MQQLHCQTGSCHAHRTSAQLGLILRDARLLDVLFQNFNLIDLLHIQAAALLTLARGCFATCALQTIRKSFCSSSYNTDSSLRVTLTVVQAPLLPV